MDMNEVGEYQYEHASLLLPWYVTGKLTASEKEEVDAILKISPKLQRELKYQQQMAQMISEDSEVLDIVAIDTQEQRLNRLLDRIDRNTPKPRNSAQQSPVWTKWPSQILESIDVFLQPLSNNLARVAFSLFLVVQVAILVIVINKTDDSSFATDGSPDVIYDLAGESIAVPLDASSDAIGNDTTDKTVLAFQFTLRTSEKEIDQLFQEIDAHVVEHPEGSTNYTVRLSGSWSEKNIDTLISRLEKNHKMIRLVGRGL